MPGSCTLAGVDLARLEQVLDLRDGDPPAHGPGGGGEVTRARAQDHSRSPSAGSSAAHHRPWGWIASLWWAGDDLVPAACFYRVATCSRGLHWRRSSESGRSLGKLALSYGRVDRTGEPRVIVLALAATNIDENVMPAGQLMPVCPPGKPAPAITSRPSRAWMPLRPACPRARLTPASPADGMTACA